jgi:hypothetical protein
MVDRDIYESIDMDRLSFLDLDQTVYVQAASQQMLAATIEAWRGSIVNVTLTDKGKTIRVNSRQIYVDGSFEYRGEV